MSQLRFQMGSSVDAQIKNINNFILARTGCHGQEYPGFLTLNQANRWMLTKPMGSVFVIYAKGKIRGKEYCHFLNAVRAVNMVYVDFQTNRGGRITGRGRSYPPYPGSLGPATSTAPFVGIITQETASGGSHLHAARQPGSFEPDTLSLRVSAFIKF
ncbi:hypothetical protein [Mixta theicola]|nr:hypothetical protein [Mixta theicola]